MFAQLNDVPPDFLKWLALAVIALIGGAAGIASIYSSIRRHRVEPQPLLVKGADEHVSKEFCAHLHSETVRRVDYYASHEALLLPYEEALTRLADNGLYYNFGAHFLWVGYRTAFPESAHIEYLRGIQNPIGIKIGPGSNEDDILTIMDLLDPKHRAGRLTLITRFGETAIEEHLPRIIDRVKQSGHPVVWSCDPMHGNTETTANGLKTRRLDAIFSELEQCFAIHERMDSTLGGVHFELTGDPVTEYFGPFADVQESDLMRCYETACDPRLNGAQALEMAFLLARLLR